MKKVYLHGALGEKFGKRWELAIDSPMEAFSAIHANTDGFMAYLNKRARENVSYCITTKDPAKIKNKKQFLGCVVDKTKMNLKSSSREIHVMPMVEGEMPWVATFFAWVTALPALAQMFVMIAASMLIQGIINMLFKPPKKNDPKTSKSYLFSGVQNVQKQGIPVPLGYGRLRIGSAVVGTTKKSYDMDSKESDIMESYTEFEVTELLSEGPIGGFVNANGGPTVNINESIYFNDTPVKNTPIGTTAAAGSLGFDNAGTYNFILNEKDIQPVCKLGEEGEGDKLGAGTAVTFDYGEKLHGAAPYANVRGPAKLQGVNQKKIPANSFMGQWHTKGGERKASIRDERPPHFQTIDGAVWQGAKLWSHSITNPDAQKVRINLQSRLQEQVGSGNGPENLWFAVKLICGDRSYNVLNENNGFEASTSSKKTTIEDKSSDGARMRLRGIATEPYSFDVEFNLPKEVYDYAAYVANHADLTVVWNQYVVEGKKAGEGGAGGWKVADLSKNAWGKRHWVMFGLPDVSHVAPPLISVVRDVKNAVVNVVKLSSELDPTVKGGDVGGIGRTRELIVSSVTESINETFLYPHSAMARVVFDSKNHSNIPERGYHLRLKRVLVPSNYDPVSRKYNGPWDGLFHGQADPSASIHNIGDENRMWTDNPAWIFYDLLTSTRFGLGKYGVSEGRVDKWSLYKIAKYCDELVETGYPDDQLNIGQSRRWFTTDNIEHTDLSMTAASRGVLSSVVDVSNQSTFDIQIKGVTSATFVKEFGDGDSFKGKKVAFFMTDGTFEERYIINSSMGSTRITVQGPTFSEHQTTEIDGTTSSAPLDSTTGAITQFSYPLLEPRFSANVYLTEKTEAIEVINQLASIFRGIIGYSDGRVVATQDSSKTTVQMFNNSNVSEEGFSYSGTVKNKRFSAVLVRYNDRHNNFKPSVVYQEDSDAIEKFGYVENDVLGFGVTSKSQALRLAKWILHTSQSETESVSFVSGQESGYLFPGAVFEVSDETRSGKDKSGRLLGIFPEGRHEPYVLLDKIIRTSSPGKIELTISAGLANETYDNLDLSAPFEKSSTDQDVRIDSVKTPQIIKFDGSIEYDFNNNKDVAPQNQSTIVSNLRLKIPIETSIAKNEFIVYSHGLNDGDRVRFISEGSLPAPLSEFRSKDADSANLGTAYYVVGRTEHTLQVSYVDSGPPINIGDTGLDEFGNSGGNHYCVPLDKNKTIDELRNIMIGAPWAIKGLVGTLQGTRMQTASLEKLGIIDIVENADHRYWYWSSWLRTIYIPDNSGWAYHPTLGWMYIGNIIDGASASDLWFFMSGIGWLWTNNAMKETFWFMKDFSGADFIDGGGDGSSRSGWVYIWYAEDPNYYATGNNITHLFIYDTDGASYKRGDTYFIGHGTAAQTDLLLENANPNPLPRKVVKNGTSQGVWVEFAYQSDLEDVEAYLPTAPVQTTTVGPGSTEEAFVGTIKSVNLTKVAVYGAANSQQGESAVSFTTAPSLHALTSADIVNIRGFNSDNASLNALINARWDVTRSTDFRFELTNSSSIADNATYAAEIADESTWSVTTGDSGASYDYPEGIISKSSAPVISTEREIKSQLFRTMSVKEAEGNKYEINGVEYNISKFDSIDKGTVIKKPILPIPPQEDMVLPTAPDSLILANLSTL